MKKFLVFLFGIFLLSSVQAGALTIIGPGSPCIKPYDPQYMIDNEGKSEQALKDYMSDLGYDEPVYKWEAPNTEEIGAEFYKVTGFPGSSLYLEYTGPGESYTPEYITLKDGNFFQPPYYVIDNNCLGWDGTDILELQGFFAGIPDKVSNIAVYGVPVPEPATMLLLGTGLVGLAGFRRKLKK